MPLPRLIPEGTHLPTVAFCYALGAGGGFAAATLGLPLPMLLGSLLVVGLVSLAGIRPFGRLPEAPQIWRQWFVPVIGVSIGAAFQPEILQEARHWWLSLLALCVFIPLVHWLGYLAIMATGRLDRVTALFGTAPGGLIEAVQMGEEMGAEPRMLTMLQFLRLILTIVLVPIGFTLMTGQAVGSGGGTVMVGSDLPMDLFDLMILIAAGVVGAYLGVRSGMPAGWVTGPLVLSGLAHIAGLTQTAPPLWLLALTQVVIGTSLGVRFAGMRPGLVLVAVRLAVLNVSITIGAAAAISFVLAGPVQEPKAAVFLAFAPGGLAEMALIALSLQMSVVYVTAHHVFRIILAVTVLRIFGRRLKD